ncbi:MAG TPA: FprA family A-type flavoprotein [Thermodesulfovibrionales bacterium]|nr:FprA family A-type flavoprotein [Thermodesulfovibrionales bacterium]
MKAVELKKDIYWVGAVDWTVRDFHGYVTPRGTTYNNYLIMDDEITLLDTVKYDFADTTVKSIRSVVEPSRIKHVVINHIENDHVTSIDKVMELTPGATIHITEKGRKGLERFFDLSKWNIRTVKTGDTLTIGKKTLLFLETPMLHWPDSMMTYIKEDKILISQDGFGQHIASAVRFDDEFVTCKSMAELEDAIVEYYANILMPFGQIIKSKLAEVQKLGLEIEMIAPDHGIIWRRNPGKVLQMYLDMANGKADLSVSIIYDTMWQSTEKMSLPIMQGILDEGVECKVIKLRATPMSIAIKEFWKSRGCLIGTPTLNNIMYPSVAEFLVHLRGLRPKNRITGAFGSYGWGGGAVKEAYEEFKKMGLEVFEPGLQVLYRPSLEDETKCYDFGRDFARRVKEYHTKF